MTDSISKKKRSWNMSRIRSKDTTPERVVRSLLHKMGYRFRLHRKDLPGQPDIVLPKYKTVIEVRGCFWHQHIGCKKAHIPKSNIDYWKTKLENNMKRDQENVKKLELLGWRVNCVWECETTDVTVLKRKILKIKSIT